MALLDSIILGLDLIECCPLLFVKVPFSCDENMSDGKTWYK